jgi:hypothetical protein
MPLPPFPSFLDGKGYFHVTDNIPLQALVSTNRRSIWYYGHLKDNAGCNATVLAVLYNGEQVFLYIYCRQCQQWRMPEEGGHMQSHHQQFLD